MREPTWLGGAVASLAALTVWAGWGEGIEPLRRDLPGEASPAVEGASFPRTLVDEGGGRSALPAPPRRIASLTLASDEVLLSILPPERLACVTEFSADPSVSCMPEEASRVAVRGPLGPEAILALEPDLVIVARFTERSLVDVLRAGGPPVLRLSRYSSLADVRENLLLLGRATGEERGAESLAARMDAWVAEARESAARRAWRPRALLWSLGGNTAGSGTLFDEILRVAGCRNAAAEAGVEGHAQLAFEAAIAADPEAIFVPGGPPGPNAFCLEAERILADPLWRGVAAVRAGRVAPVPSAFLNSLSHHAARAAVEIARRVEEWEAKR